MDIFDSNKNNTELNGENENFTTIFEIFFVHTDKNYTKCISHLKMCISSVL